MPETVGILLESLLCVVIGSVLLSEVLHLLNVIKRKRSGPPVNAEFLFYLFLDPPNCDAIAGDLEERYRLVHTKFGQRRANFWYWTQAIRSIAPIAWAWAKKIIMKPVIGVIAWAVAKGLVGHDSWVAAMMEFWKRVRS